MDNRFLTQETLDRFNRHLIEEERSCATIEKYNRDIRKLIAFLSGRSVTKEIVIAYKQNLLENEYAERSVNSMIAAINSLFEYLEWYECRVKSIKLAPEVYRSDEKELTQKEYERLVNTAMKQGKEQLALILQTVCGTGIRISELRFVTVEAVRHGEAHVHCKGKSRKIFIVEELKKLLLDYAKKKHISSGSIFLSSNGKPINRTVVWKQMKSLCKEARVNPTKVFPHNLRHLFARVFYKLEKDIAKLADILGHSSINTTRIYIMSTGKEHKRRMERMGLVRYLRV